MWRTWDYKEQAAEALKLTAEHMHNFGLVDGIIKEPLGGAHTFPEETAKAVKRYIVKAISELKQLSTDQMIHQRIEKYSKMGQYDVV